VGKFNQCSWSCKNNPKGEKSCRTDLPEVSCVRQRCNAAGDWTDMNRMPSSYGSECPSSGFKVKACDY